MMAKETKRILLVTHHNAFREAMAIRLDQEEDLEVAWQAGSVGGTRGVHLDGIDVSVVDPLLAIIPGATCSSTLPPGVPREDFRYWR